MKDYTIALNGIENDSYSYTFEIDDTFFSEFDFSDIKKATIIVNVILKKTQENYMLDINIKGSVYNLLCDICTEKMTIPVIERTSVILKEKMFPTDSSNDEIIYINTQKNTFNLRNLLFEIITLSIPNRKVHKNKGNSKCNQKMLKTIKKYMTKNEVKNDPRWEVLKTLK